MADILLNASHGTGWAGLSRLSDVERLKGYGGEITPSLESANNRIMTGGGSLMTGEAQRRLLGGAAGQFGLGAVNGLILSTYV